MEKLGMPTNLNDFFEDESAPVFEPDTADIDIDSLFGASNKPVSVSVVEEIKETVADVFDEFFSEDDDSNNLKVAVEERIEQAATTVNEQVLNNPNNPYRPLVEWLQARQLSWETFEHFKGDFILDKDKVVFQKHDLFNHIVFPFNPDRDGKARSLIARNMGQGDRYFQGGKKVLFNMEVLDKYEQVFLVEGVTDLFALYELGIPNAVACFGVEVNKKILYPLRNKTVFILFDTDFAGYEGARKAQEILRELKSTAVILEIPRQFGSGVSEKIDVGSAWAEYKDSFRNWLKSVVLKFSAYDTQEVDAFIKGDLPGLMYAPTGVPEWDSILGGGFATGMHTIGGEPEAGKSTTVTHCVRNFAAHKLRTLFCTYELPKSQMLARIAASHTVGTSWQELERNPTIMGGKEKVAGDFLRKVSNYLKIVVDWDINHIFAAKDSFDVVVIDYAQRMPIVGKDKDGDPRQGLINNLNRLSDLCREHNKIVIVISSIGRAHYGAEGTGGVFKGTGDFEYISQSTHLLKRVGNGYASILTSKNTRGETRKTTYVRVDGHKQLIQQATVDDIVTTEDLN